jgi:hypothetical protein
VQVLRMGDTIQNAIKGAADGEVILVPRGICRERLDFLGKAITLRSLAGPEQTVIDGGRRGFLDLAATSRATPACSMEGSTDPW